jgi:hypothetical protein
MIDVLPLDDDAHSQNKFGKVTSAPTRSPVLIPPMISISEAISGSNQIDLFPTTKQPFDAASRTSVPIITISENIPEEIETAIDRKNNQSIALTDAPTPALVTLAFPISLSANDKQSLVPTFEMTSIVLELPTEEGEDIIAPSASSPVLVSDTDKKIKWPWKTKPPTPRPTFAPIPIFIPPFNIPPQKPKTPWPTPPPEKWPFFKQPFWNNRNSGSIEPGTVIDVSMPSLPAVVDTIASPGPGSLVPTVASPSQASSSGISISANDVGLTNESVVNIVKDPSARPTSLSTIAQAPTLPVSESSENRATLAPTLIESSDLTFPSDRLVDVVDTSVVISANASDGAGIIGWPWTTKTPTPPPTLTISPQLDISELDVDSASPTPPSTLKSSFKDVALSFILDPMH